MTSTLFRRLLFGHPAADAFLQQARGDPLMADVLVALKLTVYRRVGGLLAVLTHDLFSRRPWAGRIVSFL